MPPNEYPSSSTLDVERFRAGTEVELTRGARDRATDVTGDDPVLTGKIAPAHLNDFPDDSTRLERMDDAADREWQRGRGDDAGR